MIILSFRIRIEYYKSFKVTRMQQIYDADLDGIESRTIPNHSIITCHFILNHFKDKADHALHHEFIEQRFTRYNLSNIPQDFCNDESTTQLFQALSDLEGKIQTQNDVDRIYDDFCTIVKNEMSGKLPKKKMLSGIVFVTSVGGFASFGGMMLYSIYVMKCVEQKKYGCDARIGKNLKQVYVQKRKIFDQRVQRCKRDNWFHIQYDMLENATKIQSS